MVEKTAKPVEEKNTTVYIRQLGTLNKNVTRKINEEYYHGTRKKSFFLEDQITKIEID